MRIAVTRIAIVRGQLIEVVNEFGSTFVMKI